MPPGTSPAADAERNALGAPAVPRRPESSPSAGHPGHPMVLTGAVRMSKTGHTRRKLFGAGLGVAALAGCGFLDDDPAPPAAPDPLRPLLDEALGLAAAYDRVAAARPALAARLAPLAADHREHATELARVIGTVLPSAPAAAPWASVDPSGTEGLASLRTAERAAQKAAVAACRQAPAARAALVGSIAAGRATHVEALR